MLTVPVFNMKGEAAGKIEVDPALFGGEVRPRLMKQAIVTHLDHQRRRSARTKGRADVEGSTRKLYRQKGTGNARAGMIRTPVRRGGGHGFAKRVPPRMLELPKQMRRLARDSAILAKIQAAEAVVVSDLAFPKVTTKAFAGLLGKLGVDKGCVVATAGYDRNTYLSGRNIPKTDVRVVDELNCYEVLRRRKLIFSRAAFDRLVAARGA